MYVTSFHRGTPHGFMVNIALTCFEDMYCKKTFKVYSQSRRLRQVQVTVHNFRLHSTAGYDVVLIVLLIDTKGVRDVLRNKGLTG